MIDQPLFLARWQVSLEESFRRMKVVRRAQPSTKRGLRGLSVEKFLMSKTLRRRSLFSVSQ